MTRDSKKDTRQSVSSLLPGIIRDRGWEKQMDLYSIFPRWKDIVSHDAAVHAEPLKIVKEVLWLEVENSAWLQQLQFQKIMLLESLNGFLQKSKLRDIRFVLQHTEDREKGKETAISFRPPPPEKIEEFEKQVAFIRDDKIRESLIRLWYLSQACVREEDRDDREPGPEK